MLVKLIAVILIVAGGVVLYQGGYLFKTNESEQVAQLGPVKVTEEHTKGTYFPPWVGGVSVAAGLFLLAISWRRK